VGSVEVTVVCFSNGTVQAEIKARPHYAGEFENATITGHFASLRTQTYFWLSLVSAENSRKYVYVCVRRLVILDLCLRKTLTGKSLDYLDAIVFEKLRFQNVFRLHQNAKPAFSNSVDLKSVFEKLRFRDGLAWTEGLTVETKLRDKFLRRSVDGA